MILNKKNSGRRFVVLMGHDKYILHRFTIDNVQLTGGWYLEGNEARVKFLTKVIKDFQVEEVCFIGSSKSNTGSYIISKILADVFPKLKMRIFAFTPFTTLDKRFYEKNCLDSRAPGSLKAIWASEIYCRKLVDLSDAKVLEGHERIYLFQFYPFFSGAGEVQLAERLCGHNVCNVPLPVSMHNTLFPFWNKISDDSKIETHEGVYRKVPAKDLNFYKIIQMEKRAGLSLYDLIENPNGFVEKVKNMSTPFLPEPTSHMNEVNDLC